LGGGGGGGGGGIKDFLLFFNSFASNFFLFAVSEVFETGLTGLDIFEDFGSGGGVTARIPPGIGGGGSGGDPPGKGGGDKGREPPGKGGGIIFLFAFE
jgi:hypothetical protein